MKRLRLTLVLALTAALVAFAPLSKLDAQNAAKRPIELDDILSFRALAGSSLSSNGQWYAYRLAPLQGDSETVIRSTSGTQEWKFPVGENGGVATFSADSAWALVTVSPTRAQAQANTRARRPNQNTITLVNLSNGEKTSIQKIQRAVFAGEAGGWLAMHRYAPTPAGGATPPPAAAPPARGGGAPGAADAPRDTAPRGRDLILRDLKSGSELTIGNVSEFGFNKSGRYLAMVIDAADQIGNGIQIRDMQTGVITPLETNTAFYERMSWTEEGDALILFKGKDDRQYRERLFGIVGYKGFDKGTPVRVAYDPTEDKSLPADFGISTNRSPQWTDARDAFIFGIAKLTKVPQPPARGGGAGASPTPDPAASAQGRGAGAAAGDDTTAERPNLMIWHYKDPRLQTQQQVQESQDRALNYVTMYRTDDKKIVRLADEEVPSVNVNARARWAIGTSNGAYELQGNLDGQRYQDVYAVDTKTGERKVIKKKLRWGNQASPDGTKYLYYENQHFWVYDVNAGTARNITMGVPSSFIDAEDDHNVQDPPSNVLGWTSDNAYVLLSDLWDVWKVPVAAGQAAVNLTVNGKKDQIRYLNRLRTDPNERGADMSKRQLFSAMAELTKKSGYGVLEPNTTGLKMALWEDASIGALQKAEKADVWIYRRETPTEAPAIYVTDASLAAGKKIVDTSAEASQYLWSSGAQLLSYMSTPPKDKKPFPLQASLYLPANYEKGKQYPLVVYIYELQTQGHNQYGRPTANGFSRQAYTSNGYAVLMPDIRYYVNDPGMSAVWALVPAVQAAIKTGVVDPKRVGLHGHSWGGYQTAFTITQTDIFAAAIAGAPLTDMISMYSIIYKNSGGTNGAIFEASQGRFTSGPWDNWAAYTRNSPVAFAKNVKTPLMILHNDADGAVDFTQGMEYFNTLRRLGKPVILLEYPGENHGLARQPNQLDYTERMKEFFDHYLKGAASPDWLEYGVPRLQMQEHIDQRLKERADREKAKNPPAPGSGRGGGGSN